MWFTEKIIHKQPVLLLRPHKVEHICIVDVHASQGEGSYFSVRIDGEDFTSTQKLNFPVGTGFCLLDSRDGKTFFCDDSIIIAAFCRFLFTHAYSLSGIWPNRGEYLPLLSREESRKYLTWHNIPHPGIEW